MSREEPDLAALIARVMPQLFELEAPVLDSIGLSMWEYAIMCELSDQTAISQVELSRRSGRDATRLGKHVRDLRARGLVAVDGTSDGRQRAVRLTEQGSATYDETKRAIRAAEAAFLARNLTDAEANELRRLLAKTAR